MLPVLFSIGPVTVYSFGLFLAVGILLATYYIWKRARVANLSEEKILDLAFLTMLGALLGARFLYVASNWTFYSEDIGQIFTFWRGGLSLWGALGGGSLTLYLLTQRMGYPVGQIFDLAAPATALAACFGYIGSFLGGLAYGAETSLLWGVPQAGQIGRHHPSQILEALFQLGLFFLLLHMRRRVPFSGFLTLSYLLLYSVGRFFFELLRGDTTSAIGPLTQAQLLAVVTFTVTLVLLYLRLARIEGSWKVSPRKLLRTVI